MFYHKLIILEFEESQWFFSFLGEYMTYLRTHPNQIEACIKEPIKLPLNKKVDISRNLELCLIAVVWCNILHVINSGDRM